MGQNQVQAPTLVQEMKAKGQDRPEAQQTTAKDLSDSSPSPDP